MNNLRPLFAEFLGTLILVLIAGMAVASLSTSSNIIDNLTVALSYGSVAILIYYAFNKYSRGHFNPAITAGAITAGNITVSETIWYWIMQFLGAIAGGALVVYFYGTHFRNGVSTSKFIQEDNTIKVMIVEAFITFILVLMFLFSQEHHPKLTGLIMGIGIVSLVLAAFVLTGAYMNPAYAFSILVFDNNISQYWMYLVGPILGAIFAGIVFRFFTNRDFVKHCEQSTPPKTPLEFTPPSSSSPRKCPPTPGKNVNYSTIRIPDENVYSKLFSNDKLSNPLLDF